MLRQLWLRTKALCARLFRLAPPAPGRFESGSKFSWRGWIHVAPWTWPRRDYLVYVPRAHSAWRRRPLLVLVHGCRQTPEDIAAGTRIADFADSLDCLPLGRILPHPQGRRV
jgi:poly(3-hydroxybutyrate) depolymerase